MAVTRELTIVYGAYTVGTTSGSWGPDGHVQLTKGFERGSFEFSFIVSGSDAATFDANCLASENAFRKPYQDLTVQQGGVDLFIAKQSTGGALDTMPEITKRESVADTGRSRRYTVRIEFGLPATTGAEAVNGLRESAIDVSYDPARRRKVTISGTFTAIGATTARAAYEAAIDAYVTTVLSGLSITHSELAEEPSVRSDVNNRLCEFSRVYDELIFSQGGSSLNDAALVRQRLVISKTRQAPGDTPKTERLSTVDLRYEAWVDKTVTTGLSAKYDAIKSWLVGKIQDVFGGGEFGIIEETPEYHYDENRFTVHMVAMGDEGGDFLEHRVTIANDDTKGWEVVPAWDGNPLSAYFYQGPRIVIRTVNQTMKRGGWFDEGQILAFAREYVTDARGRVPDDAGGGEWLIIQEQAQATKLELGLDNSVSRVTEGSAVIRMRYVMEPKRGTASERPRTSTPV